MRIFILLFITSISLFAFSMQEALDLALKNHELIKKEELNLKSKEKMLEISKSSLLPHLNLLYGYRGSSEENALGDKESSYISLQGKYNIYNGLRDRYNIKSKEIEKSAQESRVESIKRDITLLVKTNYIEALKAIKNIKSTEESLKLIEAQRDDANNFFEQGVSAKNELLKIEVELKNREFELLDAKNSLSITLNYLHRLTKREIESKELVDVEFLDLPIDREKFLNSAYENRSEIRYLENLVEAKNFDIKQKRGSYYPVVNLVGELSSYGDDLVAFDRERGFEQEGVLKIEASWNLYSGGANKKEVELKKIEQMVLANDLNSLKEEIKEELYNELERLELYKKRVEVASKALEFAEENYRISQNRYKERVDTSTELLDAEFLLTKAKNDLINAKYSILNSQIKVERITETKAF